MASHYLRREFLENESSQSSDNTTYRLELPEDGMLSALMLKLKATNGSTSNKDNMIKDNITRVEVIGNGSQVLYSLTGEELDRMTWRLLGRRPVENCSEAASAVQFQTFFLPFGRKLGDRRYGLDLKRWNDVELRIQYNLASVNAVGSTGFVSGSLSVTVISFRYPANAGVVPQGYVKTSEIIQPTDAASGERRYELPLQNKYLELGLFVREDAVADDTDVVALRIDLDNGENRLYDTNFDDLQQENSAEFNINPVQHKQLLKSDADTVDFETGVVRSYSIHPVKDVSIANNTFTMLEVDTIAGDRLTMNQSTGDLSAGSEDLTADTTDSEIRVTVHGDGVGNMVFVPFSREPDFSDALDSKNHAKIEAVITSGASGATLGLVLRELVTKQGA